MTNSTVATTIDYTAVAEAVLAALRNERDRQIVAQRYGLGLPKRHTLEKIGSDFGITRERVRQIEKAATTKLKQSNTPQLQEMDTILRRHISDQGEVMRLHDLSKHMGAETPAQQSYIAFLATLAPGVELIEDNDHFHMAVATLPHFSKQRINEIIDELVSHLKTAGKPLHIDTIHRKLSVDTPKEVVSQIASVSKKLANLDSHWGLSHWPEVNPRSIRDKTYLVLSRHGQPLHFGDIASRISELGARRRDVTVQAVHNELIKDPRFVLVGRGIYALSEWGYTPGTVADIIADILREESPLHKDEIVKRVLQKRQVKTTTIVLNLQEKDQFVRVAKATYALK